MLRWLAARQGTTTILKGSSTVRPREHKLASFEVGTGFM